MFPDRTKTLELRYADHHDRSYCWTADQFLEVVHTFSEVNHLYVIGKMIMRLNDMKVLEEFHIILRSQETVPDWVLTFSEGK